MAVKLEQLKLENLAVVDPRIEAMFQKHVKTLVDDVMNRPGEKQKRKLLLEFEITPVIELDKDTGECHVEEVKVSLIGKSKVPTFQTRGFPMKVTKGGLLFNREIPEDLHQPSIFGEGDGEAKEDKEKK